MLIIKKGMKVKLKSLGRICEENNVIGWREIRNPMLNSDGHMNYLFGNIVTITKGNDNNPKSIYIEIDDPNTQQDWVINVNWIEKICNNELNLIDKKLFEI